MASNQKNPRAASLGVNFEHGPNGAVVVYIENKELILAYLPKNYSVNERAATALAVVYRAQKEPKALTSGQSKAILDRVVDHLNKPVNVGELELDAVLKLLKKRQKTEKENSLT